MLPLNVFAVALRALHAGRAVAIATVTGTLGSTPRHLGARMAIAADGEHWGTIGGGRIEQVVVAAGRAVAGGAEPSVVHQHLVRDLGMCCGGSMVVAITPVVSSREALAQLTTRREPSVLVTPLDGGPLWLRAPRKGDPPAFEPRVEDGALVELMGLSERAILCGLGHITRQLGPLLAQLGFSVVVCDDGDTNAVREIPDWATQLVESFSPADIARQLGGFGSTDRLLIVTRDHAIDQQLLEGLIGQDALGYLGMIGSRRKVARFRQRLAAKGLLEGQLGEQRWSRLRAPIGLELGAETPEEIAVAIAAELIALRRRGSPLAGDWTRAAARNGV
ncbi:MAG TPA: XdhC family protein [Polyangiaceae bacterium]|nr:XdhC family protein [Polyangiaceae bacterium]